MKKSFEDAGKGVKLLLENVIHKVRMSYWLKLGKKHFSIIRFLMVAIIVDVESRIVEGNLCEFL